MIMNKKTLLAAAISGMMLGVAGAAQARTGDVEGRQLRAVPGAESIADPPAKGGEKGKKGGDEGKGEKHGCKGKNSCKGKGGCKTDKNACKGQNECKGKGGCATDGSKK
jgi:hypothetical protein